MERKQTILCIEEERTLLATRALVLESAGFEVLRAQDARQGLELFASRTIHAVVLPHQLLSLEGARVAPAMKRLKPAVPIVLLSTEVFFDEDESSVDAVVRKGENPMELVEAVNAVLDIRKLANCA